MKHEGFTLEFVNLVRGFKVEKVKKVINGDSNSKNPDWKNGIRGFVADLLGVRKGKLPDYFQNAVMNIDVDIITENLKRIVVDEVSLFDAVDSEEAKNWIKKLSGLKQDWKNEQGKDQFKAQSLKNKIVKETIKSLENVKNYHKEEIKESTTRAIEQVWLSLDSEELISRLKKELNQEQKQAIEDKKQIWISRLNEISDEYDYANWLDNASKNAFNVSWSTHVAKLTHSSISGSASSIDFDEYEESPDYLSTATLKDKHMDLSQTNNEFAPIGKLLKLQVEGKYFADNLRRKDVSDLAVFAKDEEQAQLWAKGFVNSFQNRKPSSHSLAKQIYFPIKNKYHLLSPLASSSLDHAIYEIMDYQKNFEFLTNIEYSKRGKTGHTGIKISYPKVAILKVTSGDKTSKAHMNVSPFNIERVGQRYLLPAMPPNWKSSLKPPLKQSSMFYGEFDRRSWKSTKSLQEYLLALRDKKSNKQIRERVKGAVNEIIGTLFIYVSEIQNLIDQAGWSKHTDKLNKAHQLWLDPYRQDEQFQQARKRGDWQEAVCNDFGRWLNHKLEHDKMKFSKIEAKSWSKILLKRLREFERDLEVM